MEANRLRLDSVSLLSDEETRFARMWFSLSLYIYQFSINMYILVVPIALWVLLQFRSGSRTFPFLASAGISDSLRLREFSTRLCFECLGGGTTDARKEQVVDKVKRNGELGREQNRG